MDIKALGEVIKAMVELEAGQPMLAGITESGGAQLPDEFRNAVRTLASRTRGHSDGNLLKAVTERWM